MEDLYGGEEQWGLVQAAGGVRVCQTHGMILGESKSNDIRLERRNALCACILRPQEAASYIA
jgi:hypothetical protein